MLIRMIDDIWLAAMAFMPASSIVSNRGVKIASTPKTNTIVITPAIKRRLPINSRQTGQRPIFAMVRRFN